MPDKTPPPRQRPAAKGRDDSPQRNGVDPSRRAELDDEPPELRGREQPAGDGTQAEEAREIADAAPHNGNLHHEVPGITVPPGMPNMCSTPWASRARMRAWAPVISLVTMASAPEWFLPRLPTAFETVRSTKNLSLPRGL